VVPNRSLRMKPVERGQADAFNAALFDGLLTCTNATLLRDAVVNGIGRGKAFGMGLLSLAVVN
jgi:CRISPR-associated protein Cas6/Cse3/CasE subtype I-E